jgi:hypothetical protein
LGWVEDEVDARAIFVFALAFGYFLPSTVLTRSFKRNSIGSTPVVFVL